MKAFIFLTSFALGNRAVISDSHWRRFQYETRIKISFAYSGLILFEVVNIVFGERTPTQDYFSRNIAFMSCSIVSNHILIEQIRCNVSKWRPFKLTIDYFITENYKNSKTSHVGMDEVIRVPEENRCAVQPNTYPMSSSQAKIGRSCLMVMDGWTYEHPDCNSLLQRWKDASKKGE